MPASEASFSSSMWSSARGVIDGPEWICGSIVPRSSSLTFCSRVVSIFLFPCSEQQQRNPSGFLSWRTRRAEGAVLMPGHRVLEPVVAPEHLAAHHEARRAEDAEAARLFGRRLIG